MKAAFATTGGVRVDEHFGRAAKFAVYEFTAESFTPEGIRTFSDAARDENVESTKGLGEAHDEAVEAKVEKLLDCGVVYFTSIGGPSAARLVRKGIMPVKVADGTDILEIAEALMNTIKTSPPPWMKKLL